MTLSLRVNLGRMVVRTTRRRLVARAYLTSEVPPNVQEARDWIAAWKARQGPATAQILSYTTTEELPQEAPQVPPHVQEAREWIAAWRARKAPPAVVAAPECTAVETVGIVEAVVPTACHDDAPGPIAATDGTLTFSKTLLDGWTYEDLFKALAAKEKN
ncbi:hypothetical protein Vretimale_8797 [Volvox reticuliferus]|uniref:Uncharacterized protein n=1 Tax=Volvox reticuliferus TaxID=1737510 RepID=A0A8J4GC11_9CHLO|nr:hypothetical protein Vretifemale_6322 [Volvox reticuliferus]GIM04174.1 hypothetical protein Vretimale_8797 [Volvox reticuliferus]